MVTEKQWKPDQSFGGLISSISYKMRKQTKEGLEKAGMSHISIPRFWVLHHLYESSLNQATLCKKLNQKPPSMMEMLGRLEADGLVKFKAHPNDPRKKKWTLTAKGERDYLKAREIAWDVGRGMDRFFQKADITPREIERVKAILSALDSDHFGGNEL